MDFPAYVPAAVRAHITNIVEGEDGLKAALTSAERNLSEIERALAATIRRGKAADPDALRLQKAEALALRDRLARDLGCLLRLAHDERMQQAFALLTPEISSDEDWVAFIRSAWSAQMNFAESRKRLRAASEQARRITKAAEALALALRKFEELRVEGPDELDSIRRLLWETDHKSGHHNRECWTLQKPKVLGGSGFAGTHHATSRMGRGVLSASISAHGEGTAAYFWSVAPDVADLVDTIAGAARSYTPKHGHAIGAATKSRKSNVKTEFLRSFGYFLTVEHNFELTTPIVKAAAIVANVALDLPEADVTYDDARKALTKPRGEKLEDSSQK
jgi:hypothetical protein